MPVPRGPFKPDRDSLRENYRAPGWFLDGKFGILLHWGVYSVAARQSEWYPRHMYSTKGIAEWGKEVTLATKGMNDAGGPAYLAGSVLDFERGHPSGFLPGPWQTDTTVHSRWGYLADCQYRSVGTLVRELVDNVSKGGTSS